MSQTGRPLYVMRTRGGPGHGFGNVVRLAAFARYCLSRSDAQVHFVAEGPVEVAEYLISQGFAVTPLAEDLSVEQEREFLSGLGKADAVFMEVQECTPELQRLYRELSAKLVVFDDLLDQPYEADLVVCGQLLPGYGNKSLSAAHTEFLTGMEYFPFSMEMATLADREREYAEQVRNVLVCFGGRPYEQALVKAALALADRPDLHPRFVLGYGPDDVARRIAEIVPHAEIFGGVEDMTSLFFEADVALVNAGYLKLEAALTGTPAVMVATQWHQIPLAQEFHRATGTPYAGYMSHVAPEDLLAKLETLAQRETRSSLAQACRRSVDGRGMERIYNVCFGEEGAA